MRTTFAATLASIAALTLAACNGGEPDHGPPSATYTVHGIVRGLPDAATGAELEIQHEAIPNFVNETGAVVGMPTMVMPFPVGKGVSLAGLQKGDKVELTFAVWWEPQRHWEATKIVELPADTPLDLGAPKPTGEPASTQPNEPAAPPAEPPAQPPSGG